MPQNGQPNNDKQPGLSWSKPQQNQPPQNQPVQKPAAPAPQKAAAPKAAAITAVTNRSAAKITAWLAVGVVAGVLVAWGASSFYRHSPSVGTTAGSLEAATSTTGGQTSSLLTVAPQKAGLEVAVGGVNVSAPTWVVVYESRNGMPGNVLGTSLFFPGNSSGTVELLRGTVAGQTYFVTQRLDNGDHQFSLKNDALVTTDGQPQWATFVAN